MTLRLQRTSVGTPEQEETSAAMDPETFLEVANHVSKLKMYPYFEIAHCAVTLLYLREDLASGEFFFSKKKTQGSNQMASAVFH